MSVNSDDFRDFLHDNLRLIVDDILVRHDDFTFCVRLRKSSRGIDCENVIIRTEPMFIITTFPSSFRDNRELDESSEVDDDWRGWVHDRSDVNEEYVVDVRIRFQIHGADRCSCRYRTEV